MSKGLVEHQYLTLYTIKAGKVQSLKIYFLEAFVNCPEQSRNYLSIHGN